MTHSTTEKHERQVKVVPPIDIFGQSVYFTKQGENFAELTYLNQKPKKGVSTSGRLEAMSDTKDIAAIRRAVKKLKGIIRANFGQDFQREAHLTLTYRGSMTDTEKLQVDLKEFIRLLRSAYSDHKFEYVAVMEPHGHGGWHIHLLLKSDKPIWYDFGGGISYKRAIEMWRKSIGGGGAVRFEKLPEDVRDFGLYFAAYFTTAIPEAIEMSGDREAVKEASKASVKGSRIHFYPSRFKFYRTSRGILKPKTIDIICDEKMIDDYVPVHAVAYEIVTAENEKTVQFIQQLDLRKR
jgi:hypothetical protein